MQDWCLFHLCFLFEYHVIRAKVACSDAIRQARVTRVNSEGLKKLANVNLKRSEAGSHHVFRTFGQSIDVKISKTDLPSKRNFPYVGMSEWLRYIVENDQLEHLVGVQDVSAMRPLLTTFWNRWKKLHPDHVIFGRNDLEFRKDMCIPVLHHGDEGRGQKKKQLMVLSTHGMLGKGSRPSNRSQEENDLGRPDGPLNLNMIGNTFLTHFLCCVLPISLYNETPESLYHMLDLMAKEYADLFNHGVMIRGKRFFLCCIGVKGDAPYLAKSGRFERSFTRRPTRATSRNPASGLCHLCLAGRENHEYEVPFEWYPQSGWGLWVLSGPFRHHPHYFKYHVRLGGTTEDLWYFDLFHNFHSGMGKYFASSAVVTCMELIDQTIDLAFCSLTFHFKEYCARKKESPYHKKLTKALFGVEQSFQDCPDAAWSKGDFTRLILKWFGDYCATHVSGRTADDLYLKCVSFHLI